jgi:hypothetical protein
MCFSASASFAAAGLTTVAGVAAFSGARQPAQRLLAAVPLLFAIHQFAEGVLWLALSDPGRAAWAEPAILGYLIISKVVWPVWVPLTFLALEAGSGRRRLLGALLILGAVVAPAMAYGLGAYPVSGNIAGPHIQYRQDSPLPFRWVTDLAYALVIVLPPLIASNKLLRVLGVLLLASLVLTKIFFYYYFASVWCFFAALISVLVVLIVRAGPAKVAPPQPAPSGT